MKAKHRVVAVVLLVTLAVAALLAGGFFYIHSVQNALWDMAVTDILEVTAQGRHALDVYLEKDADALHLLAIELAEEQPGDADTIQEKLRLAGGDEGDFLCVDLERGIAYTSLREGDVPLREPQLEVFQALQGQGMREPFLEGRTGVWTVGVYERFFFADGTAGYLQKVQPRSEIADRFSLSFYGNTGFSYVVNREGAILIRSQHRNSNRTFQNLFDIIDLQGNSAQAVESFQAALADGQRGVARFQYQNEDYVFCYVPLENADGWYVVSIVPDGVIMEQAETITRHSQVLFAFILAAILVLAAIFLIYRHFSRRVLQMQEAAREAAESANRSKSRFLSNMSHDIRTPMNAVLGMARLAADHAEEPQKVREYMKNIQQSGQLLVGLINDVLDLSKIESGKMTLRTEATSLADLLADMVTVTQPIVRQRRQRFEAVACQVSHETLCFDGLRLRQVLLNLLSNAVKFTPEGGSIRLEVEETPSPCEGCAHLIFRVSDSGIGMKAEFLEHLFTSFVREQDSRVDQIEGSGLGMAITKMLVDLMGGTISVDSAPGKGTAFTVEVDLPLSHERVEGPPSLPPLRVLVADSDEPSRQAAAAALRDLGAEVQTAEGGEAVAQRAQKEEWDLILLGWQPTDPDGFQAVRAIRRLGKGVSLLLTSACDWSPAEEEALALGVTGFLQKPLFPSALRRCLRQYALGEASEEEAQGEEVSLAGRRILLAEDNPLNREIAQELLQSFGAQVEAVENGLACVERFASTEPDFFDLILLDVHMPVMGGHEAARQIRAMVRADAATVPILAMTADVFAEDIQAAMDAGMSGHLAKPLDVPAMLREISGQLRQKPA